VKRREMAKKMVGEEKIPLKIALQVANVNRTGYYYLPKNGKDLRKKPLDPALKTLLENLNGYESVYGYRKVTELFVIYNHKKVYRHMSELHLLQPRKLKKKRYTRLPIECPVGPDIRWEGDLTYVFDGERLNYLFAVADASDKEIIGDHYGMQCRAEEAISSLDTAVQQRFGSLEPCPYYRVSLRVDQGSQYVSKKFRERAKELGVKLDFCGIDCPDDKPFIECFFARYKCEEVYRNEYRGFTQAFSGWAGYKKWYNNGRIHQGLNFMTIPEFKQTRGLLIQPAFLS